MRLVSCCACLKKPTISLYSAPSGPPINLIVKVTSRSITLSWSLPLLPQRNGVIINYLINFIVGSAVNSIRQPGTSLNISADPFTSYSCTVSAATVVGDGPATAVISGVTDEESECFYIIHRMHVSFYVFAGPGTPPNNLSGVSNDPLSFSLTWEIPTEQNGVITEYQLQCSGGGQMFSRTVMGSQTTTTLSGLLPYTSYSCNITAHTSVGGGPAATTSVTTEESSKHA